MFSDDDLLSANPADLMAAARLIRDRQFGDNVTYSRKVFIPLSHACRDVCHYCTFAKPLRRGQAAFLNLDAVLAIARQGRDAGCGEALFTLGDKPELRYRAVRDQLEQLGHTSTLGYLKQVAAAVLEETGLVPHLNPGVMTLDDLASLRPVAGGMGLMLEGTAPALMAKGGPHFGSPDKDPAVRLQTIQDAGTLKIPFTSGLLIGIGETRQDRLNALRMLQASHLHHGHLQEVIIQNFLPKPDTKMAQAPAAPLDDQLWTIAAARLIMSPELAIQAPPNLAQGPLKALIDAGINDWGGVSPITPDHVNPEAPWPHLEVLARLTAAAGKLLVQRTALHPSFAADPGRWLSPGVATRVKQQTDALGFWRDTNWVPGRGDPVPPLPSGAGTVGRTMSKAIARAVGGVRLEPEVIAELFASRGADAAVIIQAADELRKDVCGDQVSYVVTRNINYTNICTYRCGFCAFSKGKMADHLRGRPYDLPVAEVRSRVAEAWARGATEVCMQGGIHPSYTGQTYLDLLAAAKSEVPEMHVHAFSPLEVSHGAQSLNVPLAEFLSMLKQAGLGSLPGTAAEILDDEVRQIICPDKLSTAEWLNVMRTAHRTGLRTTATIMFGHADQPIHWARHLLAVRDLQAETGGFTEFVPLPFVPMESPLYLKGQVRGGPTWREAVLMQAIARLVLHPLIPNIQVSWVKLGPDGAAACLDAGANDLGGTLMNESITRAAGAAFGQEMTPQALEAIIAAKGRSARPRTTLYGDMPLSRMVAAKAAVEAAACAPVIEKGAAE